METKINRCRNLTRIFLMNGIFILSVCFLFAPGAAAVFAQQATIDRGLLNGKATSLPSPVYSSAAVREKAAGAVRVYVVVDEKGSVISAQAAGDSVPILRPATVAAAQQARFAPYLVKGKPIKFSGFIVYNFVLPPTAAAPPPVAAAIVPVSPVIIQTKPAANFTGGRFTSNDAEIYYEVYGAEKTGKPLVVVHGGPGFDHQYFLSNSAFTELAKNRPVIFYDQRGTGKSEKVSGERASTIKNSIEDLENLRKHLGYQQIELAGHSWGGLLAVTYAVFFPAQVSHLIMIDSVPAKYDDDYSTFEKDYPNENAEMQRQQELAVKNNSDSQALRASIVAYMKMLFYSPANREAFIAGSAAYTYDINVFATTVASAEGFDITRGLAKLTMPVLILHGRHDSNINVASSEKIHQAIPKSQLVIFEQSGHLPFYEEKDKFVSTIENFLGS